MLKRLLFFGAHALPACTFVSSFSCLLIFTVRPDFSSTSHRLALLQRVDTYQLYQIKYYGQ